MSKTQTKTEGKFAHIFVYCVPKKNHGEMLDVTTKLSKTYQRHGSLGIKLYVWGESTLFQGFTGIQKQLGANPDDEVWIEVDSYKDASHLKKVVESVGADKEAYPLWEKLMHLVGPGRSIAMGEFERVIF
jgi:Protein of unknown function (DUF1428)